jgi:hypothetical protein
MPKQLFIALFLVPLVCSVNGCKPTPPANYNTQLKNIPDTIRTWDVKDDPDSTGLSRVIKTIGYTIDSSMNNAVAAVGKYGFVDKNDSIVVPIIFDYADLFHEGVAKVILNNKYGFIDAKGNVVIDFIYDTAYPFTNGWAKVSINDQHGFIDHKGKIMIPLEHEWIHDYNPQGLAMVEFQKKHGFINRKGQLVIPIIYTEIDTFVNQMARAQLKDKWGIIDTAGNILIPFQYDNIAYFSDDLLCAKKDGKYGFVDLINKVRIPFVYDIAWDFNNGKAEVLQNNQRFYINKNGERIDKNN